MDKQFEYELDPKDLKELLQHATERKLEKGEPVYRAGDDPDILWYVKEGRIHITQTGADGRESMLSFHTPGKTFCLAATLIEKPYPCEAHAGTDAVVLGIPAARFKKMFDRLPDFAKHLLIDMAPQFCESHCNCAMSVESVDKRLAATLLRLDRQFQGGDIPFTRQELAQMVNTTVETCIRVLSQWGKDGILEGGRGKVRLLKRAHLDDLVEELA